MDRWYCVKFALKWLSFEVMIQALEDQSARAIRLGLTSDSAAAVRWFMSAWISGDLWQVVLWINTLTQLGAGRV